MRSICIQFLLLGGLILAGLHLLAQSNGQFTGTDFWLTFNEAYGQPGPQFYAEITAFADAEVTVESLAGGWSSTLTLSAGQSFPFEFDVNEVEVCSFEEVEVKGIHITSTADIGVVGYVYELHASGAWTALPTGMLGSEYFPVSQDSIDDDDFITIVAVADNTEIVITPTATTSNALQPFVDHTITLDAGEVYRLSSHPMAFEGGTLSGSWIRASENNPDAVFAVYGGAKCGWPNVSCIACDHLVDQIWPTSNAATSFLMVPFAEGGSYVYMVQAVEDSTLVYRNGQYLAMLDKGDWIEQYQEESPIHLTTNHPAHVYQMAHGITCGNDNMDPELFTVMPSDFSLTTTNFTTFWGEEFTAHYATIIVASSSVDEVYLDGELVSEDVFHQFDADPDHAFALIELDSGTHQLACVGGFQGYVFGHTEMADSYVVPFNGSYTVPVLGCVDENACNYDPSANTDDGSCEFPVPGEDCDGNCLQDEDQDGICDYDPETDLNGDGYNNTADLLEFMSNFGCVGEDCVGDLNGDGLVNVADLIIFLSSI